MSPQAGCDIDWAIDHIALARRRLLSALPCLHVFMWGFVCVVECVVECGHMAYCTHCPWGHMLPWFMWGGSFAFIVFFCCCFVQNGGFHVFFMVSKFLKICESFSLWRISFLFKFDIQLRLIRPLQFFSFNVRFKGERGELLRGVEDISKALLICGLIRG